MTNKEWLIKFITNSSDDMLSLTWFLICKYLPTELEVIEWKERLEVQIIKEKWLNAEFKGGL